MIRLDTTDTIVALSSAPGPSIRSIVRLSGSRSWSIAARLTTDSLPENPQSPRSITSQVNTIDELPAVPCRIQFWPAGRSYTGQELVECHLDLPNIATEPVIRRMTDLGARPAEAGEFTLRAFLEGRIDLTRAEAVAGLFQAFAPNQLEVALSQLAGGLGRGIERLRDRLLDLLAWLEATLDFVEEADVDPVSRNFVAEELRGAAWDLERTIASGADRDFPASARRLLLVGPPNAGKSLLFNTLSEGAGRALVSVVSGTTRDYLEANLDLGDGRKCVIVDTAGVGELADDIDARSQAIGARERLLADLLMVCIPAENSPEDHEELLAKLPAGVPRIVMLTKCDLIPVCGFEKALDAISVSAMTGVGIEALRQEIRCKLDLSEVDRGSVVSATRIRAGEALRTAVECLKRAADTIQAEGGDELVAMDLRSAVEALDVITGRDVTEEILDRVFSRFCIGK